MILLFKKPMNFFDIAFYIFTTSFIIQLFFQLFFQLRVSFHKNQVLNQSFGISLIICSRNEEKNLRKFIPKILNQQYENFEVIVVVDRSWDNSIDYLNYTPGTLQF